PISRVGAIEGYDFTTSFYDVVGNETHFFTSVESYKSRQILGIVDHTTRDHFVAAPLLVHKLYDPLVVIGIDWEDSDIWHFETSLSVVFSSMFGFAQPERNMRWLHRLLYHRHQMFTQCVQINLVA